MIRIQDVVELINAGYGCDHVVHKYARVEALQIMVHVLHRGHYTNIGYE